MLLDQDLNMEFLEGVWSILTSDFLKRIYSSFISSFLFIFFLLYVMRPKVCISPYIRKSDHDYEPNEPIFFMFKVVNHTRFPLFNVDLSLSKLIPHPAENGNTNYQLIGLELKSTNIRNIARCPLFGEGIGYHAILFRTYEDLEDILSNRDTKISFEITAKHGLTGLSRSFRREFVHKTCIKNGEFGFGKNLDII